MSDFETNFDSTSSCDGSEELNGKDASTRSAPMISAPRLIQKMRIKGALVPISIHDFTSAI
jgi:hypothetical protein